MNNYDKRGTVQVDKYIRQLVSFDGMKYKGKDGWGVVTPTDIDGFIQLDDGNIFVFFELKHNGGLPTGQARAYTKMIDAICAGGGNAILFVAHHHTEEDTIDAKNAIVKSWYGSNGWNFPKTEHTLDELISIFIEHYQGK